MGNFIKRSISALLIAVIIITAIVVSEWALLLLAVAVTVGSMCEFYRLLSVKNIKPQRIYTIIIGVAVVVSVFMYVKGIIPSDYLWGLIPLAAIVFIAELYRKKETPLENIAVSLAGIIYISLPMALLPCLGFKDGGYDWIYPLGYVMLIWVNDVGAYLVGVSIGKHRLFPRISPNKSWEGFWGGVVFVVAAAWAIAHFTHMNTNSWMIIGLVLSLSAVAGDLVESMFKRAAGVKDAGNFIPGHGGFLDRFDAMFISLPFVYLLVKILS